MLSLWLEHKSIYGCNQRAGGVTLLLGNLASLTLWLSSRGYPVQNFLKSFLTSSLFPNSLPVPQRTNQPLPTLAILLS